VIPNTVALLTGAAVIIVTLRATAAGGRVLAGRRLLPAGAGKR
jgi:hypothetical protein